VAFGEQPAYLRVASDLRRKIVDGALPPHTRLPSQARIREEYGVSDTVALEARKVLMAEGLVEGRSGSGTYVRERPVPRRVARSGYRAAAGSNPFRQEQADGGAHGTWESSSEQTEAPPEIAARLGIEPGDRVMRTRYVFRVAQEDVGARPGLAEELMTLGGVPGHVVLALERTYYASGRAVETADVVVPADRFRISYHLSVK
jgi:DNA-binding GntR family transcriptional regulator